MSPKKGILCSLDMLFSVQTKNETMTHRKKNSIKQIVFFLFLDFFLKIALGQFPNSSKEGNDKRWDSPDVFARYRPGKLHKKDQYALQET